MSSDSNKTLDILPDGMRVRSEEIGFAAGDLLSCPKCARPNSPDRKACIYCGTGLGLSELAVSKPADSEALEAWENGYTAAIRVNSEELPESSRAALSRIVAVELAALVAFRGVSYLPVARMRKEQEAHSMVLSLRELGNEGIVVSDVSLMAEKPPVRLRSIEFGDDKFTFVEFNTGNRRDVLTEEIRLIVTGELIESRTETKWKKKPKKSDRPDETTLDSDRPVIDIYTSQNELGYRVQINGFDFSSLGPAKTLLAAENMKLLAARLQSVSKDCRFDKNYALMRPILDKIWELETETDHFGDLRAGFSTRGKTKISMMNNMRQFTKYSRLQRLSI